MSLGVQVIIGAHPHVLQPHCIHDNKLVAYSLGNFLFYPRQPFSAVAPVMYYRLTNDPSICILDELNQTQPPTPLRHPTGKISMKVEGTNLLFYNWRTTWTRRQTVMSNSAHWNMVRGCVVKLVLKLIRSVNNVYEPGISLRTVSISHSQPASWFDSVPGMHHSKGLVVTGFCGHGFNHSFLFIFRICMED